LPNRYTFAATAMAAPVSLGDTPLGKGSLVAESPTAIVVKSLQPQPE
jgi:hypothetical protein